MSLTIRISRSPLFHRLISEIVQISATVSMIEPPIPNSREADWPFRSTAAMTATLVVYPASHCRAVISSLGMGEIRGCLMYASSSKEDIASWYAGKTAESVEVEDSEKSQHQVTGIEPSPSSLLMSVQVLGQNIPVLSG